MKRESRPTAGTAGTGSLQDVAGSGRKDIVSPPYDNPPPPRHELVTAYANEGRAASTSSNERTTRAYALARIRFARESGPIPSYGSREWLDLPADDVRKAAAVWIAAECWRQEYEPERIAERHLIDLAARRDADAADWTPVAEWVRRTSDQPTHDELSRRRTGVAA